MPQAWAPPLLSQHFRVSNTDGRASPAEEIKEFELLEQGQTGLAFFCAKIAADCPQICARNEENYARLRKVYCTRS